MRLIQVKLKTGEVIDGAVWPAGSILHVSSKFARELIEADKAEAVDGYDAESDQESDED